MNTLDLNLELTLREEPQDGYLATLYGRAVPYGETIRVGGIEETVEREAFEPSDVIGKPLCWRHGEPIGKITAASNADDGLYITASILDTAQGRDANTLLRGGAVTGLSVGFIPVKDTWNKAKTAVKRMKAAAAEVSLTHMPAYATAGVSAIREETVMETTETVEAPVVSADVEAREQIAQLREKLEALVNAGGSDPVHPLAQYRDIKEFLLAVRAGEVEERALNVSALSEQTGMVPPTWLTDVKGVIDATSRCINAIGGPVSAGTSGLDIKFPKFAGDLTAIVAAQANENDEVNSADIDITVGTATLATYAAANRLTYQVIERAEPSYVQAHLRILAAAFAVETDYAFQNTLWANDTVTSGVDYDLSADTTGANFLAAVWKAAAQVEDATGAPPEVIYVDTTTWNKIGDPAWTSFAAANYPIQNVRGTFDATTMRVNCYGIPVVRAQEFATDETETAIVTNRLAVGWAQDGPRFANAEQAANLGRDVAIYGYGVGTPWIPAGIVSIYNTP